METPDDEITQPIDLAALRGELTRKPRRKKLDLYEVTADSMAGDTMPGLVRKHNEDAFACCSKPDGYLSLAIVADGIGGREYGEIASSACVATMIKAWRRFSSGITDTTWENAQDFLIHAVMEANDLVYKPRPIYHRRIRQMYECPSRTSSSVCLRCLRCRHCSI